MKTLVIFMTCVVTTWAQYDSGPVPPRLAIPGAISGGGPQPGRFRQGRLQNGPVPGAVRVRRPGRPAFKSVDSPNRPPLQALIEDNNSKPVTEEPEDELHEINTPSSFISNGPAFSEQDSQDDFFSVSSTPRSSPSPNQISYQSTTPSIQKLPEISRPPQPYRPPNAFPLPIPQGRPEQQKPQPARLQPLSFRPARPQLRPEPKPQAFLEDDEPIQPIRYSRPSEQQAPRQPVRNNQPPPQKYSQSNSREKKPVAQVIRKYREDNPDGSITWGFENDDGSFKEEIIGVDCVTRGKYGYIDPDGLKREYSYETGIACDKNAEPENERGFIDYQENKAVLPNGITIDLAAMGKKSKRPFRAAVRN